MTTNEASAIFVVVGTLLPIVGVGASVLGGIYLKGASRWALLYLGPAITGLVCNSIAGSVMQNGNMLAMIIYILFFIFLVGYYPGITILAVVLAFRNRQRRGS